MLIGLAVYNLCHAVQEAVIFEKLKPPKQLNHIPFEDSMRYYKKYILQGFGITIFNAPAFTPRFILVKC